MPKINFDEVPDSDLVAEGRYRCVIERIVEKTSSQGNEMWRLRLRIIEGQYQNQKISDNLVFSEKALSRVKMLCKAVGIPVVGAFDLQPQHLYEKEVAIDVIHEEYQGQKQAKVPFRGYFAVEVPFEGDFAMDAKNDTASKTLNERMSPGRGERDPADDLPFPATEYTTDDPPSPADEIEAPPF